MYDLCVVSFARTLSFDWLPGPPPPQPALTHSNPLVITTHPCFFKPQDIPHKWLQFPFCAYASAHVHIYAVCACVLPCGSTCEDLCACLCACSCVYKVKRSVTDGGRQLCGVKSIKSGRGITKGRREWRIQLLSTEAKTPENWQRECSGKKTENWSAYCMRNSS